MYAGPGIQQFLISDVAKTMNWDISTYPQLEKGKRIEPSGFNVWSIPSNAKNKDLSMKLIKAFNSEVIVGDAVMLYEQQQPIMDRNFKALLGVKQSAFVSDRYTQRLRQLFIQHYNRMITERTDTNTAIMNMEQLMRQEMIKIDDSFKK